MLQAFHALFGDIGHISVIPFYKLNKTVLTLSLYEVNHATFGEYNCVAKNIKGEVKKTVIIVVDDGSETGGTIFGVCGVCLCLLVGVAAALVWRHWHLRRNIRMLTR